MENKFALIGEKLSHSISPKIHSEIFREMNMDGQYGLVEIPKENLKAGVMDMLSKGVRGFNITIPYKVDIMPLLDEISREASEIGAVNTVKKVQGKLYGYNTDYNGIALTFNKYKVNVKGKSAVILGSGGASAAVLQYLKDEGCSEIVFVVRNIEKVKDDKKLKAFKVIDYSQLDIIIKKDILINCTPSGMYPKTDECPVPKTFIKGFTFVFDMIYNPSETMLLKFAKENGIIGSNGLLMLVGQAFFAEKMWNEFKNTDDLEIIDKVYKVMEGCL